MKTLTAAMTAHINGELTTLATCWHITRTDGVELFITDHDADIVYGGDTYAAATGIARTSIESSADMSVDNLDVVGILGGALDKNELLSGHYDFAEFDIFSVNWVDPDGFGTIQHRFGTIGEIQVKDGSYTGELRGMMQLLERRRGKVWAPDCRANLFSPLIDPFSARANGCGVASAGYEEYSVVDTVTSDRAFTIPDYHRGEVSPKYLGEWGDQRGLWEPNVPGRLEKIAYGVGAGVEDGTPNRPIILNSAATLVADINANLEACFILSGDFTLAGNHVPIGTAAKPFTGQIDGRGHALTISCDNTGTPATAALFGVCGGTIGRLGVTNSVLISGDANTYAASIVGLLYGNDPTAHPLSGGGRLQHCFAYGNKITTNGNRAGGIVGNIQNGAWVAACVASSEMIGTMGSLSGAIWGNATTSGGAGWYWGNFANTDHAKTTVLGTGGWGKNGLLDAEFRDQVQYETLGGSTIRGYDFVDRHVMNAGAETTPSITLTFAVAAPDTILRASGSWKTSGFRPGDLITVSGTTLNDGTYTVRIAEALLLTLDIADSLAAEVIATPVTFTSVGGPWILDPGRGLI